MTDENEHDHKWHRNPTGVYRMNPDQSTSFVVKCSGCPAKGWGRQDNAVLAWPAWHGPVDDVDFGHTQ